MALHAWESRGRICKSSLAISAFLMVYGAGLLAIGFWKRSAFIRWQALILLVFTIGKTFLYDTRDLSQGYRVLSFLGLGALLMAISFAYQKDWLALRESAPTVTTASLLPAKELTSEGCRAARDCCFGRPDGLCTRDG